MMKLHHSILPFAVTLGLAGCELREEASGHEPTGDAEQAIAADPATSSPDVACGPYTHIWNGTKARIYHPRNGTCADSLDGPLVLIFHAAGGSYTYDDYDYLQQHLAENGFISASFDILADSTDADDQEDAAEQAWTFTEDFLLSAWAKSDDVDPTSIALIGHSRGGDTVRYLADYLESDPVAEVKSVVLLAPAKGDDNWFEGDESIGTMHIMGTDDGDVSYTGSYYDYEHAGENGSQSDPGLDPDVLYKSLKLVENLSHPGFTDGNVGTELVKGYVLAFLAAHNQNDVTWYEDYVRGNAVPGGWTEPVFSSYRDGFYRRVIDHFEDGADLTSTIGGAITTFNATAQVLDLGDHNTTYVHDTKALWTWGSSDGAAVTWSIPVGKRNASAFEWLSVRIGQASGAPTTDLRIQIRNGLDWSPELRLTDYGPLAQPTELCGNAGCVTRSHMATIRVPLAAFGAFHDVQYVRLRFRGTSVPKTFVVDDLEFSEWILKP